MNMKWKNGLLAALAMCLAVLAAGCGAVQEGDGGYQGISVASPDWVGNLEAAASSDQMLVVAAFDDTATDAWVSLHEKQSDGTWRMVMTTPGFIGKMGLGKTKEGEPTTPAGTFHFNRAFGIADDPGCAIPYVKADGDTYWSSDQREGHRYNELVSLKDVPDLDTDNSEHILDYPYHYQYCLNISYNEECTPGLGSAIFLHCLGPAKPFTGGCVAIPESPHGLRDAACGREHGGHHRHLRKAVGRGRLAGQHLAAGTLGGSCVHDPKREGEGSIMYHRIAALALTLAFAGCLSPGSLEVVSDDEGVHIVATDAADATLPTAVE